MPYVDYVLQIAPSWLSGDVGSRLLTAGGMMKDALAQGATEAVRAGYLSTAPADALPYQGATKSIEQYPGESDTTYRMRLASNWTTWQAAGTVASILASLAALGAPNAVIYENWQWGSDNPAAWWRFWVYIPAPNPFSEIGDTLWNDPGNWGDGGNWGADGNQAIKGAILRSIKKWKPAHAQFMGVVVQLTGRAWGSGWTWGSGTWSAGTSFFWS